MIPLFAYCVNISFGIIQNNEIFHNQTIRLCQELPILLKWSWQVLRTK